MEEIETLPSNDIQQSEYQNNNDTQVSENQINNINHKVNMTQEEKKSNSTEYGQTSNSTKCGPTSKFRFCSGEGKNRGMATPCTWEKFNQLIDSEEVKNICDQIVPLMEGYWSCDEQERKRRKDAKDALKENLPFLAVHSQFFDDDEKSKCHRSNKTAHDNGVAMLDIDGIENPEKWWQQLTKEQIADNGIFFCCITPSTYGLHILADRRPEETIKQAQDRLAMLWGLDPTDKDDSRYDKHTHDACRMAYLSPRGSILHIIPEKMCFQSEEESKQAENRHYDVRPLRLRNKEQGTKTQMPSTDMADGSNKSIVLNPGSNVQDEVYTERGINIPYSAIIDQLMDCIAQVEGPLKCPGNRHNYHLALCNQMRYLTGNDPEKLVDILPNFSLDDKPNDLPDAARDTCAYEPWKNMPSMLRTAIDNALQKIEDEQLEFRPLEGLPIPRLPKFLQTVTANLEDPEYIAATIIAALPVLGAAATGVRYQNYHQPDIVNSFSFISVMTADSSVGKSTPLHRAKILATPLRDQRRQIEDAIDLYKEECKRASSAERKPQKPKLAIRYFNGRITSAFMVEALKAADGKHLLVMSDEIRSLKGDDGRGTFYPGSDAWIKAYGNEEWSTHAVSLDAAAGSRPMYCNCLTALQPQVMWQHFDVNQLTNGSTLRCAFAYLSHQRQGTIPPLTPEQKAEMIGTVLSLMEINYQLLTYDRYQWLSKPIDDWRAQKLADTNGKYAKVLQPLVGRLPDMTYRAGLLYSIFYRSELGENPTPEQIEQNQQDCVALALWTAEYIYRVQTYLLLKHLLKSHENKREMAVAYYQYQNGMAQASQNKAKRNSADVLAKLNNTFTRAEFVEALKALSPEVNDDNIKTRLSYLCGNCKAKRAYIRKNDDGTYTQIIN